VEATAGWVPLVMLVVTVATEPCEGHFFLATEEQYGSPDASAAATMTIHSEWPVAIKDGMPAASLS